MPCRLNKKWHLAYNSMKGQTTMDDTSERLYKASEWQEAERDYKRHNPSAGDYWYEDMFVPMLVVLDVNKNFVTFCQTTKDVGNNKWTWDLSKPEIISRNDFVKKVERFGRLGGSHYWAVEEFKK